MKKPAELGAIDIAAVQSRMLTIRNQQVLLDRDVAALYGVETKALNQAVKRNAERFPEGYILKMTDEECSRSQKRKCARREVVFSRRDAENAEDAHADAPAMEFSSTVCFGL